MISHGFPFRMHPPARRAKKSRAAHHKRECFTMAAPAEYCSAEDPVRQPHLYPKAKLAE